MASLSINSVNAARNAVLAGLKNRAEGRGFWTEGLRTAAASAKALKLCDPHRVALLPFSEIQPDASLRAASQILGWRFLIFDAARMANSPIAAAHAVLGENGQYRLAELNEGPFVEGTRKAFETIPPLLMSGGANVSRSPLEEQLLLFVPAVYFAGIWLRHENATDDTVWPIYPRQRGLHPFMSTDPAKLLGILHAIASKIPVDDGAAAG